MNDNEETINEIDREIKAALWKSLVQHNPELAEIRFQARAHLHYGDDNYWRYYEYYKAQIKRRVGWLAPKSEPEWVRTMQAYDVAHKEIFG